MCQVLFRVQLRVMTYLHVVNFFTWSTLIVTYFYVATWGLTLIMKDAQRTNHEHTGNTDHTKTDFDPLSLALIYLPLSSFVKDPENEGPEEVEEEEEEEELVVRIFFFNKIKIEASTLIVS